MSIMKTNLVIMEWTNYDIWALIKSVRQTGITFETNTDDILIITKADMQQQDLLYFSQTAATLMGRLITLCVSEV
jgi:hypothetical protein